MRPIAPALRRCAAICALAPLTFLAVACSSGGSGTGGTGATSPAGSGSGAPAPTATATSSPSAAPGTTACTTAGLRVTAGASQGAAGTSYTNIDFTNVSGSPCTLTGYPGVSLVTAGSSGGTQIGAAAQRQPTTPVTTITLAPGKVAHAVLGVTDAGNYPSSACQITTAHWLKVFPPNQYTAAYLKFTTQTCSLASEKTMFIQAVSAGA